MTAVTEDALVVSDLTDLQDTTLDHNVNIYTAEYARIMRGLAHQDGGLATPVSAFNSSI
jgi:hypothetical protein